MARIRLTFVARGFLIFALVVLAVGLMASFVFRETHSPALEELGDDSVWDDLPLGSAVWEAAVSHDDCDRSEQGEYRLMGLFVADRREALKHYEDVLVAAGWSVEPIDASGGEEIVLRATRAGENARLAVSVVASDRRTVLDSKDGEWVPESRPAGFDQESDYVSLYGTPDPECES